MGGFGGVFYGCLEVLSARECVDGEVGGAFTATILRVFTDFPELILVFYLVANIENSIHASCSSLVALFIDFRCGD
jgi:hypothetical protein